MSPSAGGRPGWQCSWGAARGPHTACHTFHLLTAPAPHSLPHATRALFFNRPTSASPSFATWARACIVHTACSHLPSAAAPRPLHCALPFRTLFSLFHMSPFWPGAVAWRRGCFPDRQVSRGFVLLPARACLRPAAELGWQFSSPAPPPSPRHLQPTEYYIILPLLQLLCLFSLV